MRQWKQCGVSARRITSIPSGRLSLAPQWVVSGPAACSAGSWLRRRSPDALLRERHLGQSHISAHWAYFGQHREKCWTTWELAGFAWGNCPGNVRVMFIFAITGLCTADDITIHVYHRYVFPPCSLLGAEQSARMSPERRANE